MSKTLSAFFTISLLWYSLDCAAQLPQLYFHHLTNQQGLTNTPNIFVFKDSKGYVWISSTNGLNQFDGKVVRSHQPNPDRDATMLGSNVQGPFFEDINTNIWFSTFEGINCYERKTQAFRHYFLKDKEGKPRQSNFTIGLDGHGLLWLLHRTRHVYTLDTRTGLFTHQFNVPTDTHRGYLLLRNNGRPECLLSFSTNPGVTGLLLDRFDENGKHTAQQRFFDNEKDGYPSLNFKDAFFEKDGICWLGATAGLLKFKVREESHQFFPIKKNGETQILKGIAPVPNGLIACATDGSGLWFFDEKQGSFIGSLRHITDDPNSLLADQLDGVETDQDGVIWVGVKGRGLSFASFEKTKFDKVTVGLPKAPSAQKFGPMLQDSQGRTWCTTFDSGLFALGKNDELIAHYGRGLPPPFNLLNQRIYHLFEDKTQRIWLMANAGLYVLLPGERRFRVADASDGYLHGIQLRNGRLLFCRFQGGVWELEEAGGQFEFRPVEGPDPASPWTILHEDSQQRLWGSHDLSAVSIFAPQKKGYRRLAEVPLAGDVSAFYEEKNAQKTWVASSPGLHSISHNGLSVKQEGLADLAVSSLLHDGENGLWLGTNRGMHHLDLGSGRFERYGLADGLTSLESGDRSAFRRNDGSFWFGNATGLVSCGAEGVRPLCTVAIPQITSFTVNDTLPVHLRCSLTGAANPTEIRQIQLRHHENLLGFTFTALEYSDPANCRIRYKLEGADPDTVEVSSGTQVRYPNLPPGDYDLRVWASNSDGVWNPVPHELSIEIRPAFWQTWWFKLLSALSFMAVVASFFYLRDQQRQRLQGLRDRLSRDLHDELGSTLSSISILSESAKHAGEEGQQGLSLEQIGQRAREAMESVSDMVWAIKPQNDPLPVVIRRMRLFAAETLEPKGIAVRFKVGEGLDGLQLVSEQRKEVFLIFKEAVNNCAKYSHATKVEVGLMKQGKHLVLTIEDDGVGFDLIAQQQAVDARLGGNGLRNMAARAAALKADFSIKSSPGAGTQVLLEVPLVP